MHTTWRVMMAVALGVVLALWTGCPADDDDSAGDDATGDDDTADDDTGDDDTGDDDTVDNAPPTAPVVAIDPEAPTPSTDLTCVITEDATDPDGDPLEYNYLWTVDGASTAFYSDTVLAAATVEGEEWACYATAFDGHLVGPAGSASAVIGPFGFMLEVEFNALGGEAGGAALVDYQHVMIDEDYNEVCRIIFEFDADYTYGNDQADSLWGHIDEVITFTGGGETFSSCPEAWALYETDPVDEWLWSSHPLTVVSCDQIEADELLAAELIGMDNQGYIPTDDGTFGDFCENVGPAYQSAVGSGPMEGVWLMPGESGSLDPLGTFGYFAPPDTTDVEAWMLLGVVLAASDNDDEPVAGMKGDYLGVPFWLWVYG